MEFELLKGGALRGDGGKASFSSSDEGDLPEIGVAAREGSEADIDVIQRDELLIKDKAGGGGIRVDWDGEEGDGEVDAGAKRGVNEGGSMRSGKWEMR